MNAPDTAARMPIVLAPGAGRACPMGRPGALFKAGGEERTRAARAGVLNLSVLGPFEPHMPAIVQWCAEHPPTDTHSSETQLR